MAKLTVRSGASARSEYIFINDSTSTTGAGLTGLVFNSAGLTAYYVTERGTPTAITLVTLASATAAYSSGGFIAVDATNLPGVYRLDIPAAVFATTKGIVMLKGATNMVPVLLEYDVVAYDPTDTVRLGLTAIPNVAQGTTGAISTGNATGQVTVATNNDKTGYSLTQTFPTNFASMAITAGGAVTAGTVSDKTGYSLATAPPTAAAIATQVWSEALPGTYTSGQAGFKLNAAGSAADPWSTALPGAYSAGSAGNLIGNMISNTWNAGTRTLTAGTNIVLAKGTGITGFNDITAQSVWDVLASSVSLTNSIGLQLKTNIDATVSSRLSAAGYTAPLTASATASAVWDALLTSYTTVNTFGRRIIRGTATSPSYETFITGSNHIASDVHQMQPDTVTASAVATDAVTEITKGIWNQARSTASASSGVPAVGTFGYFLDQQVSTAGGGGGGSATASPSVGPFTVLPSGAGADNIVDLNVGSVLPMVLNLQDGSGAPFNASGATITAMAYTAGGSTVTTYTGSIIAGYIGAISVPLSTAVTATSATYTMLVSVVIGTTTTVFGPLKLVVRAI
jgi:hypothetical protein